MQNTFLSWMCIIGLSSCVHRAEKQPVEYINPFIGTSASMEEGKSLHGLGKTFPGAATPFGMIQLSPDTRTGGDNAPGYSWHHKTIEGFSFMHLSGTGWYGEFGNFLVMATTGRLHTGKGSDEDPGSGYRSRYSHDKEEARAGYYSVVLEDYGIGAEVTAAPRAGMLRFTFPEHKQSRIQIDLARRIGGTSTEQYVKVMDDSTITGWMKCPPEGGGWGNGKGKADYTLYFCCRFSKPLATFGIWSADIPDSLDRTNFSVAGADYQEILASAEVYPGKQEMNGKHLGFYTEFPTTENEQILVKTGLSFVSEENAEGNLEQDIPDWDFDGLSNHARKLWNDAISVIRTEGGTEIDREVFYTALYHAMIDPRIFSDHNGQFTGPYREVHIADDYTRRTIFSGWDVFRSLFPLFTLIRPDVVRDEIRSMLHLAGTTGKEYLPQWEILNSYSACMLGNPAVSVIVDAYEKGIRNFDVEKAFEYCLNTVNKFGNNAEGYSPGSLSETLEYAYSDWCMGTFAESLGRDSVSRRYYSRSLAYKTVWDDSVHWFRTRNEDGSWMKWEGKKAHGQGCMESNPYQQGWFVPHDIEGLIRLMGKETFIRELSTFFDSVPAGFLWNDYYNHANEPVHHVPFLFNEAGLPHLTQKWTRAICKGAYSTSESFGYVGNEDEGQMSAWYVLASIGIHPICPGDNRYQITSPVFSKIEISMNPDYYDGTSFSIIAHDNSDENMYIQSMKLNGQFLNRNWIFHDEISKGGKLELFMGPEPVIN
ncbi:MAG: GH92 family glycosyl hydrolase [Bacteroidota bacterium]